MLIFHAQRLVVFAIPRTGSTSLHAALRAHADVEFNDPPNKKHMTVRRFETWADPEIAAYTRLAVMRDPLARIASWYRYRRRPALSGSENSAEGISFDAFIDAVLAPEPPPMANIGNQHRFLSRADGTLGVDALFCLERRDVLTAHLKRRFGPIKLPHRHASDHEELDLDPAREARLRAARAAEFTLFDRVAQTGHLSL